MFGFYGYGMPQPFGLQKVASQEELIEQSVLQKIAAAQMGSPVTFTPEEIAYLVELGNQTLGMAKMASEAAAPAPAPNSGEGGGFWHNLKGHLMGAYNRVSGAVSTGWNWAKGNKKIAIPLALLIGAGTVGGGYYLYNRNKQGK